MCGYFLFCFRNTFSKQYFMKTLKLNNNHLNSVNIIGLFGTSLHSLQHLLLNNNKIHQITGKLNQNTPKNNLKRIDLRNNELSRFFVAQFWQSSSKNLTIILENNSIESLDFRNIDENLFENQSFLTIDLGEKPIICNCYTIYLFEFLTKQTFKSKRIYEKIKINPTHIRCEKLSDSSPDNVLSIIPENTICPLDSSPHLNLCPHKCKCMKRLSDKTLVIECENITVVPTIPPFKQFELDQISLLISRNNIKTLPRISDIFYNDVTEIYASYNLIEFLTENNLPNNLQYLDLKNNLITIISPKVLDKFKMINSLYLSQNYWECSAPFSKEFIIFVKTYRTKVKDFQLIQCTDGKSFLEIEYAKFCYSYIMLSVVYTLIACILLFCIVLYCVNHEKISEWVFENDRYNLIEKSFDIFKPFDACIICTKYDKIFGNYIGSKLIECTKSFKCCLLIKTWISDKIPNENIKVFRKSRRVIVILSKYFNENNWKQWSYANINSRVIFITKGSIRSDEITLKNKIILNFNDPLFWDKLQYFLIFYKEQKIVAEANVIELLNQV